MYIGIWLCKVSCLLILMTIHSHTYQFTWTYRWNRFHKESDLRSGQSTLEVTRKWPGCMYDFPIYSLHYGKSWKRQPKETCYHLTVSVFTMLKENLLRRAHLSFPARAAWNKLKAARQDSDKFWALLNTNKTHSKNKKYTTMLLKCPIWSMFLQWHTNLQVWRFFYQISWLTW